jgi:predicted GIY-YIG superfamily endonuclease
MTDTKVTMKFCLYRYYGEADKLIYIGRTTNFRQRQVTHRYCEWWPLVQRVSFEFYSTKEEIINAEALAIWREQPVFNKDGKAILYPKFAADQDLSTGLLDAEGA